jgi:hypothetical protein
MQNIFGTRKRAPLVSFVPSKDIITNSSDSKIIRNGGELTYLDYLPSKQKIYNISRTEAPKPLVSLGPSSYTKVCFEKGLDHGE